MTHIPRVYVDGREFVPKLAPAINQNQTLAQYLKQLREEAGVSPADVEAMTGLRAFQVEAWERETSTLRFSEAALLARVYGVSLDLFGARIMAVVDSARGEAATQPPFISHPSGTVVPVEGKVPPQIQTKLEAEAERAGQEPDPEALAAVEEYRETRPEIAAAWDPDLDDTDEFVESDAPAAPERSDALEQAEEQAAIEEDIAPAAPEKLQTKKSSIANLLRDL